ncbi:MAG: glycosyltransferase [Saprospiraceae bacterium]|nr:glycosyltransferase [Saprospiraceae bacterium]
MDILIVNNAKIPVQLYGGTERVIWDLGKELSGLGHRVSFLVQGGSHCDFAPVRFLDERRPVIDQIPKQYDVVHFHFEPPLVESFERPYLITMHGNANDLRKLDRNTVFVSNNHAERYGSTAFVHNGLDWNDYTSPDLHVERTYFHFLGKAAWRVKNVKGAIEVVKATEAERLRVLGGVRFNVKMGLRFTFSPRIRFYGMVGGTLKHVLLNGSKGLIFPVRWHEPFGLSIIESLYYGCPVFGTPYGSLPELVSDEVGFLSNRSNDLSMAILQSGNYSKRRCHEYACDVFNSRRMALDYLKNYEQVINGGHINPLSPALLQGQTQKFLEWLE